MNSPIPPLSEAWLTFVGVLDLPAARALTAEFANAAAAGIGRVHFLIQSPGGSVSEGVFLFNFISQLPLDVVAYNCGHVGSASVTAYLGAKRRVVSPNGTFLIHRARAAPGNVGHAGFMSAAANSLVIDDARTAAILSEHIQLTPPQQEIAAAADLTLSALEAVASGIAHETGYFKPNGILRTV